MPGFIALKLCPHLKFIKPDFKKYEKVAALARQVFQQFDVAFCSRGLDEASLCITEYCREHDASPSQVGRSFLLDQSYPSVAGYTILLNPT